MAYDAKIHHRRSIRLKGYDYAHPGWYFVTVCTRDRKCLLGEVVDAEMRMNDSGRVVQQIWYATEKVRSEVRLDAFVVMPNHLHGIIQIVGATRRVAQGEATPRPCIGGGVAQGEATPRPYGKGFRLVGATRWVAQGEALPRPYRARGNQQRPHGPARGSVGAIVGQMKSLSQKAINRQRGTPGAPVWERNYFEHVIRNSHALQRCREYICNNPLRWPYDAENPERAGDSTDELEELLKGDVGPDW